MNRIRVAENPVFSRRFPRELLSELQVLTRSGARLIERAEYPRGHAKNPLTDADVESKFRALAGEVLAQAQVDAALRALWRLDDTDRVRSIVDLFTRKR